MYSRLERLYKEGKLTKENLQNAVKRGWITQEEYEQIVA